FGLLAELAYTRDHALQLGALADQLLGAAVVLPEARRSHLGVELAEALFLLRDVKDASAAHRRAEPLRRRHGAVRRPSRPPPGDGAEGQDRHREGQIRKP